MNEQDLEILEKIFPNGFMAVYGQPDSENHIKLVLLSKKNPNLIFLYQAIKILINELNNAAKEKEDEQI